MTKLLSVATALFLSCIATGAVAQNCNLPANQSQLAAKTLQLINAERARKGRSPLRMDAKLQAAARAHACDMSAKGYFSHRGQDGSGAKRRLQRQGCRAGLVAENIAAGQKGAQEVVQGWMASPGHRKNILLGRGTDRFGIGIVNSGRAYSHGYLWVLVFARGC